MRGRRRERGQISIMIAMMMMTFMFFFAFVINTGMLVNAKINLQNAADLAAYAGAAVQARQLNHISFLNYEMRRQYKKLLFRYYVMGNMAQETFPRSGGGGSPQWAPKNGTKSYDIPTVCVITKAKENFCQVDKLPGIKIPPSTKFDTINETLRGTLQAIGSLQIRGCNTIGATNALLTMLWLYNTDPSLGSSAGGGADSIIANMKALAFGLGIVPREILLSARIKSLQDYVNATPQSDLRLDAVNAMAASADPAAAERSVQAFLSAYYTLGNHTFPGADVSMDELLPKAGSGANLLQLRPIKTSLALWYVDLRLEGADPDQIIDPEQVADDSGKGCTPTLRAVPVYNLPVGVSKDPRTLTYYAIRLKARARLLFSPFGDLTLKAYAAAQPFGSRIGPPIEGESFISKGAKPPTDLAPDAKTAGGSAVLGNVPDSVPNLPIQKDGDSSSKGGGWWRPAVLSAYFNKFKPEGAASGMMGVLNTPELERAYQAAMAPNPWEGNRYNIPSDRTSDEFLRYYDETLIHSFWAPIVPPDQLAKLNERVQTMVNEALASAPIKGSAAASPTGPSPSDALKKSIQNGILAYMAQLKEGKGEDGEGINIVRLRDPFRTRPGDAGQPPRPISVPGMVISEPKEFMTSWTNEQALSTGHPGRIGYSVKLVSFSSLTKQKSPTNDADTWVNDPATDDAESAKDIPMIQH